jgi:hypothetical protein
MQNIANRNRQDHAAENPVIPRKLALDVPRIARSSLSLRHKRERSGRSGASARSVIGQMRGPYPSARACHRAGLSG